MLRIAICDDVPKEAEYLRDMISKYLFSRCDFTVKVFRDGKQIMEAVRQGSFVYDLLFLDIHMQTDGLTAADYIRKSSTDTDIIFTTVSTEHVYDGYLYKAFAYLLKPIARMKLERELGRYLDEKDKMTGCLNVTVKGVMKRIPLDSVLYFESNARKVTAVTRTEAVEFYGKLDEIEEEVADGFFFRCHQSYIINLRKATGLSRAGVIIETETIPVSRKYFDALKSRLI